MKRSTSVRITAVVAALALVAGVGINALAGESSEDTQPTAATADHAVAAAQAEDSRPSSLSIEVAEDGTRFVFAEKPVLDNDFPAYGNPFVTQGYIYPAGTLTDSNGVNGDGSPEFPHKVIGEWTCWGYFVGEGANTTEGAWVTTTQIFEFHGDVPGEHTIVTIGFETPAGAGPAVRAVTGGTGAYNIARGEVTQVTLGHNVSDGVNATFEFSLRGARAHSAALGLEDAAEVVRSPH